MKETNDRDRETKEAKPFFARFLEGQEYPRVQSDLKAGCGPPPGYHTCKYPSDGDDGGPTS